MKPRDTLAKEEIRKLIGCLRNNRERIHYPDDRIVGYPIEHVRIYFYKINLAKKRM